MNRFSLDSQLEHDSTLVTGLALCDVRLIKDSRWPWLVLVPRLADVAEIHELTPSHQQVLACETALCAFVLKSVTGCTKINSGALGNVVRQLHIHVIARNEHDPNWPGPVWGFGKAIGYPPLEAERFTALIKSEIEKGMPADGG